MKGFDFFLNNQKINVGVEKGVVSIILDNAQRVSICGRDGLKFQSINWIQRNLSLGDKIKIIATELEASDSPTNTKDIDTQELLVEYYKLKEMLIREGRLK